MLRGACRAMPRGGASESCRVRSRYQHLKASALRWDDYLVARRLRDVIIGYAAPSRRPDIVPAFNLLQLALVDLGRRGLDVGSGDGWPHLSEQEMMSSADGWMFVLEGEFANVSFIAATLSSTPLLLRVPRHLCLAYSPSMQSTSAFSSSWL